MIPLLLIFYLCGKNSILFYLIINYILSVLVFLCTTRSYFPHMKLNKETRVSNKEYKSQYYHETYPAFNRIDLSSISLLWIYYGFLNYFWIKAFVCISSLLLIWLLLVTKFSQIKEKEFTLKDRQSISRIMKVLVWMMYTSIGVNVQEKNYNEDYAKVKDIYTKYMGESYNPIEVKDKFTTIISNHSSWFDIFYLMSKTAPSFIAKDSIKSMPLIGTIAVTLRGLLIDRKSKDSKKETKKKIAERQMAIVEGKEYFPLCLFPEGTTTNGRVIISFKKGAFFKMTPVKPFVIKTGPKLGKFSITSTTMNIMVHIFLVVTFFKSDVEVIELPVITPNDYMIRNYSHLGKDEVEIFSEVSRRIMSEVGGIPLDGSTFDDKLEYLSRMRRKVVKNT